MKSRRETADPEDVYRFGDRLEGARNALGKISLTRAAVAEGLHISQKTIITWEAGTSFPEENLLPDISKAYDINLEELTELFRISQKAYNAQKDTLKSLRAKPRIKTDHDAYLPGGSGRRTLHQKMSRG